MNPPENPTPDATPALNPILTFRSADARDANRIAALHADSWRCHYRGAYSATFLDGDVEADRREVWGARLTSPGRTATILAEHDDRLIGFVHIVFDDDPTWGSLVDNLHVANDHRRARIGTKLLKRAANAIKEDTENSGMFLWVLEQNIPAQKFYVAMGANPIEVVPVQPPGGDATRLSGSPNVLRMAWFETMGFADDEPA